MGYAREIEALFNALQIERVMICGYSSGSIVAQEFALIFPNRTLALILVGGFPKVGKGVFKYEHLIGMYMVKRFPDLLAKGIAKVHTGNKSVSEVLYKHMLKCNHLTWFQFYEQSFTYSCVERLNLLNMPLLLIYGSRDLFNQHIKIYKKYTNFELAIVEGLSHQAPTKKWEHFNQLIIPFVSKLKNRKRKVLQSPVNIRHYTNIYGRFLFLLVMHFSSYPA